MGGKVGGKVAGNDPGSTPGLAGVGVAGAMQPGTAPPARDALGSPGGTAGLAGAPAIPGAATTIGAAPWTWNAARIVARLFAKPVRDTAAPPGMESTVGAAPRFGVQVVVGSSRAIG
jgi:hypothetical protein